MVDKTLAIALQDVVKGPNILLANQADKAMKDWVNAEKYKTDATSLESWKEGQFGPNIMDPIRDAHANEIFYGGETAVTPDGKGHGNTPANQQAYTRAQAERFNLQGLRDEALGIGRENAFEILKGILAAQSKVTADELRKKLDAEDKKGK